MNFRGFALSRNDVADSFLNILILPQPPRAAMARPTLSIRLICELVEKPGTDLSAVGQLPDYTCLQLARLSVPAVFQQAPRVAVHEFLASTLPLDLVFDTSYNQTTASGQGDATTSCRAYHTRGLSKNE